MIAIEWDHDIDEVAPLAGAWIEIFGRKVFQDALVSLPSRERGLKSII